MIKRGHLLRRTLQHLEDRFTDRRFTGGAKLHRGNVIRSLNQKKLGIQRVLAHRQPFLAFVVDVDQLTGAP
ncbi:hypothetical protein D3C75_738390 [compost metagenome]